MGDVQQTVCSVRTTGHHIESWARNGMSTLPLLAKRNKTNTGPFQGIFAAGGIQKTDWPESAGRVFLG
jgi:hypothetical protein